jgi:hypothetical protein
LFDPAKPKLTPEAIQIEQLLGPRGGHRDECGYSTGISVCRLAFASSRDELRRALEGIVAGKPNRRIEGFARTRVQQIWNITAPEPEHHLSWFSMTAGRIIGVTRSFVAPVDWDVAHCVARELSSSQY